MRTPHPPNAPLARLIVAVCLLLAACSAANTVTTSAPAETTGPPATDPTGSSTSTTSNPPAPAGPADPLMVIGDWGSGTAPQGSVAGAMARFAEMSPIAGILTTGDNFYNDDADFLMMPFGWAVDSAVEFWITWGNHDIESEARIDAVNSTFDSPPRWTTETWGRFEVLILDSNQVDDPAQLEFLEMELDRITTPTIIVFHHPAHSCSRHGPTEDVVEDWLPLFDQDVVLVLSGHEHNYQRFEADGVVYVVTGGGGRSLHKVGECSPGDPELQFEAQLHHYLLLEDDGTTLVIRAVDVLGETFDTVEIVTS